MLNHHAYTKMFYHLVWATKDAQPFIKSEYKDRIYNFIGQITINKGWHLIAVGGIEDHIHILIQADASRAASQIVCCIKSNSSRFIRDNFLKEFEWQGGYSAFTVDVISIPRLKKYIENQTEHHKKRNFQEEYILILRRNYFKYKNAS